jgi:hypothetical protein
LVGKKQVKILVGLLLIFRVRAFAVVPLVTDDADPVDFGHLQFNLRENVLLSVLAGSTISRESPELTGYLGFS